MEAAAIATVGLEYAFWWFLFSGVMLVGAIGISALELRFWLRTRRLAPIITDDQQPAHPPTGSIPIQITKVNDRRRRTVGLNHTPPPEIEALP